MGAKSRAFDAVIERCWLALRLKYPRGTRSQAELLFETEIRLIQKLGFEEVLAQIVELGDQLRRGKVALHLVGSGGSSMILFLLGFSEVDPIRHGTHLQRFWLTANAEPPIVQFVAMPTTTRGWDHILRPAFVTVHPMTGLEAIPAQLERRLTKVCLQKSDNSTFASLQAGDTDGIFQLESEHIRGLLCQIRPNCVQTLACATALDQVSHTHPEMVAEFLEQFEFGSTFELEIRRQPDFNSIGELPIIYQETIMSLLRSHAGLPWHETYRFVRTAAKGRMTDHHELWNPVLEGLERRHGANGNMLFHKLVAACRWAVCRAHHVANAITSYKAAYFRTHHQKAFERTKQHMMHVNAGA